MVIKKVHFDVRSLTPDFYAPTVDGIYNLAELPPKVCCMLYQKRSQPAKAEESKRRELA